MEKRFIYGLFDPRKPDVVMCVGETKQSLVMRLCGYRKDAGAARRGRRRMLPSLRWILKLSDEGVKPEIRLIATTNDKNWRRCERRFISIWRKRNPGLLNVHPGGNGCENADRKIICDKCGGRREQYKNGMGFCRKCRIDHMRSSEEKERRRSYAKTGKQVLYRVAYHRSWRRRPEAQKKLKAARQTPQYRAKQRARRRSTKGRAWQHAYYLANKKRILAQIKSWKAKKKAQAARALRAA